MTALGYAREYGKIVRIADRHVMCTTRTVFDLNHWAGLGFPDLDGAACAESVSS